MIWYNVRKIGLKMAVGAVVALAKAIGYPEEIPAETLSFAFSVDDARISAVEEGGRLVLTRELAAADDVDLVQFAQYAAGRLLKEEAVLAYDPQADRLILWQDVPASSEAELLKRFFEVFTASCDWWQARVRGSERACIIPDMMIRP